MIIDMVSVIRHQPNDTKRYQTIPSNTKRYQAIPSDTK